MLKANISLHFLWLMYNDITEEFKNWLLRKLTICQLVFSILLDGDLMMPRHSLSSMIQLNSADLKFLLSKRIPFIKIFTPSGIRSYRFDIWAMTNFTILELADERSGKTDLKFLFTWLNTAFLFLRFSLQVVLGVIDLIFKHWLILPFWN